MKRTTKIVLLCIFIPCEAFFCLATLVALFMFPPVGVVGLAASTLYMLVIISIFQSLKGKKPILNDDQQREALIKMAEDYIYLNPPDHQKWLSGVVSAIANLGEDG